jgi:hypothetical protein
LSASNPGLPSPTFSSGNRVAPKLLMMNRPDPTQSMRSKAGQLVEQSNLKRPATAGKEFEEWLPS